MSHKISNSYKNYVFSLVLVAIASLLVRIWGNFTDAPSIIKLIFSFALWFAILLFPWSWIKSNDFCRVGKILINSMLLYGVFEIIRSIIFPSPEILQIGNRFTTLFFNEYCTFIFVPPLYVYTIAQYNILPTLFRLTKAFIFGGILVSIVSLQLYALAQLSTYIVTFWKYVTVIGKILIFSVFIFSITWAILGARVFFIFVIYSIAAYFLCYKWNIRILQKTVCIVSIFIPTFFFLPLLSSSADKEESNFKVILDYVGERAGNGTDLKSDTRTFLYLEMALDLDENNSWLIGKGANSRYYSSYFSKIADGDSSNRLTSEVPFLLFMLRGGLIYTALYLSFLLLCIYRSVWKGKSSFLNCIGIMIAGWFANLFVGDVNGCSFFHLVFYSLCGLSLSTKWLNMSDRDIYKLIRSNKLLKI